MTDLHTAARQALEALTNCSSEYGHRCNRCDSEVDEGGKVAAALSAALQPTDAAEDPCCGEYERCTRPCTPRGQWLGERKARAALEAQQEPQPVAWAIFTPAGNARLWATKQDHLQRLADAEGLTLTPLYAAPQPTIPQGWVLVPEEPDHAMLNAGMSRLYEASVGDIDANGMEVAECYRAMLAAAPKETT